jgi:AcrR family transcriptional regulator
LSKIDKFERRREQLALSALTTLSELGYAQTSLRDIARDSGFSHGILHYYFRDKADLIIYCVRHFSVGRAEKYDSLATAAVNSDELKSSFISAISVDLSTDAEVYRMWYDLRNQSLFDPSLRSAVAVIDKALQDAVWRIFTRYAEMSSKQTLLSELATYAAFDGLINLVLIRNAGGNQIGTEDLCASIEILLAGVVR